MHCSPYLDEPELEPRDVRSELDEALELADSRLARCWALLEEMGYDVPERHRQA